MNSREESTYGHFEKKSIRKENPQKRKLKKGRGKRTESITSSETTSSTRHKKRKIPPKKSEKKFLLKINQRGGKKSLEKNPV